MKTDGMAFIHLGFRDGEINFQRRECADVIFDPDCTDFNGDPSSDDSPACAVVRFRYNYQKGLAVVKGLTGADWTGKIVPGVPSANDQEFRNLNDKYSNGEKGLPDDMTIDFGYHLQTDKFIVIAGSSATKIMEGPIPFKVRNKRGKLVKRIPVLAFEFSDEKKGPYPISLYSIIKDVAVQYTDALDRAFQHFKINMNPYLFLFTDAGSTILKQMRQATKNQDLGAPPLILAPTGENVRMESVDPNADVFTQLQRFRDIAQDALGARLGMNFRQQEQVRQTFSEFERKNQFENQAIAFVNRVNKKAHSMMANYTFDMIRQHGEVPTDEKLLVTFKTEDGDEFSEELKFSTAIEAVRDWNGTFDVDVNIKLPVTSTEKMATINEINAIMSADIVNTMITTPDMGRMKTDVVWEKVRLRDLEDIFNRTTIAKFYESIVQRNTGAQQAQAGEQEGMATSEAARRGMTGEEVEVEARESNQVTPVTVQ